MFDANSLNLSKPKQPLNALFVLLEDFISWKTGITQSSARTI